LTNGKAMRIVHLTQHTTADLAGGVEQHIAYLAPALRARGHDVIVLKVGRTRSERIVIPPESMKPRALGDNGPPPTGLSTSRSPVKLTLRSRFGWMCESLRVGWLRHRNAPRPDQVAATLEALKPDVIHQHAYLGGVGLSLFLTRSWPVVLTNHTGAYLYLDKLPVIRRLQQRVMTQFDAVIGPSRELVPRTANGYYIPNGVDSAKFHPVLEPHQRHLSAKHGCQGRKVFFCPRRWAPTKGVIYLAKALRHLKSETCRGSVFVFAGNETPGYGQYQKSVADELARASGCDVRILGNLDHRDLSEWMSLSDACIIPSLLEATSLACLEAMACGIPVIGSATGGLLELIEPGWNGWLVPKRDPQALADRIEAVCQSPRQELEKMGQRGRSLVCQRYSWHTAAKAVEKVYLHALKKHGQSPSPR